MPDTLKRAFQLEFWEEGGGVIAMIRTGETENGPLLVILLITEKGEKFAEDTKT
jgi:hypothetical protein